MEVNEIEKARERERSSELNCVKNGRLSKETKLFPIHFRFTVTGWRCEVTHIS